MGNTAKKIRTQIQDELHAVMQGSTIDFSMLSVDVQIKLIKSMSIDKKLTQVLCQKNKPLLNTMHSLVHTKIKKSTLLEVQKNVNRYFSESSFVDTMTDIVSNRIGKTQNAHKKPKNTNNIAKTMLHSHAQLSLFRLLFNSYET